ncbi:phosphopantetheine-binding protein [Nodularia spumigena CS-584]|jgi:acyl carrier protein|uniref:Acyl carrier protein n=1 Tax=Nodularia spumigena UHCC 0060 TaxID=3110300 RepID=A0ABU5URB7_NODSP|nr:phosphopantetheine-binding protein [Nodularia spumigena]AHJ27780.1 Acyl carrier protein [Nodularia spumigena CCY9414]EAW43266.1 hypothetical protein N9414_17777 [Nodularia spumigena CCY9414]MDB9383228.1 phosphopantetheine-binding protein [Nodularia spumigena CS-584]MEA5526776.1 phosphopantetheine-binding protein [Nodularia spumigena UHCC 0143]MEA5555357.1 phosphopantetheine-binding protein [Nodularia spumigena CH309]
MTINNQDYEIYILTKVINNHLDEVVEFSEDGLNSLLSKHDEMVWNIATKIYSQSGYKVEFSFIRDVLNSWIEILKERIAAEKIKLAEQARLQAGWQAKQPIIQAGLQAEQARLQTEQARIEAKRVAELAKISISDLFLKVQPIISELLCVELDQVALTSHISNDLGADVLDQTELIMAIEEEFDIEIPDDNGLLSIGFGIGVSGSWPFSSYSEPVFDSCTVRELLEYIRQQLSNKYVEYEKSHPSLRQNNK